MSKLQTLCNMYTNVEEQIQNRQKILDGLTKNIMELYESIPENVRKAYVELPESLSNTRQRIDRETQARIYKFMCSVALELGNFTRPELLDVVQEQFPSISENILNRLFTDCNFRRVGQREGERGNPIIYSAQRMSV